MIEIIIIALFATTIINTFLKKVNLPTIIGYIITGIIVGYLLGSQNHGSSHAIKDIAEFGIVFLMFTIGLDFSLPSLVKMKRNVFLYGSLQFFITSSLFFLISKYFFGLTLQTAIIVGIGLSLSSTAVVLKILNENDHIKRKHGKKSLGVLLFQDLAVIPAMILITIFSSNETSTIALIGNTLLGGCILIILMFFISKYLLDYILIKVSKSHSNEVFIGAILAFVLGFSYMSHSLGLSYSFGALIAGIMISGTHFKRKVESDLVPFRDLLLGVFFLTIGMQLNLMLIYENILLIIGLLFGIILLKMLIIYTIIRPFYGNTIALRTALTLFQIGELAIVVFETANVNGVLDSNTSQILIITIVISIILTPFVLQYLDKIVGFILKSSHKPENNIPNKKLENHIILIGYGETGILLSNMLEKEKKDHYIVEHNIYKFQEAKDSGKLCFYGDASKNNILESLNIEKASGIIISLGDSSKLIYICDTLSQLGMEGKTIVNVINKRQKAELEKLNFSHIIYKSEEVSKGVFAELSQLEQKTQKSKNSKSLNEIRDDTWT